jgi:hypothetical protein
MRLAGAIIVAASTALTVAAVTPAAGVAITNVGDWRMGERAGATVMVDSSGNRLDGTIGSAVRPGVSITGAEGGTAYQWAFTQPNAAPAKPERLVQVRDNSLLDPGTRDYAVTIRYSTTQAFGNLLQKGQSGARGGYWKFQAPKGVLSCLFRGAEGSKSVNSGVPLNDGAWHTVRCERTADRLTMTVDAGTSAQITRRALGVTGNISNSNPLTIGGKANCDQITITCDYFTGAIDYVRIQAG